MKLRMSYIFGGIIGFVVLVLLAMSMGINDNGYRRIIQSPSGQTTVRFEPGWYICAFCKETTYPDVLTYDLQGDGIKVRYQDGGLGKVDGVVRVELPNDAKLMLDTHKAFRSEAGIRAKLLEPEVLQALNLTAGLMTSEEAYAVRRNDYAEWASDQVQSGSYSTELKKRTITMQDGTTQVREVPTIRMQEETGLPVHRESPFKDYGLSVSGFQITDWNFEPKTLEQIDKKRSAEMAIITARANADKALWEQKEIKANGEKEVERTRYEQLRLKEEARIKAERSKEVAVITAEKQKEVNEQILEAAKIDVKTAKEQATALKTRADAEAYSKKAILLADGALDKKLKAFVETHSVWAKAYSTRKVPQMVMGSTEGGNEDASVFQQMINAMLMKDLALNPKVTK